MSIRDTPFPSYSGKKNISSIIALSTDLKMSLQPVSKLRKKSRENFL